MKKKKKSRVIKKKKVAGKLKKKIVPKKKKASKKTKRVSIKTRVPAVTKTIPTPASGAPATGEVSLGEVEDYFSHLSVITINLDNSLSINDTIHVSGHTTNFIQKVESIQMDHVSIPSAKKGDPIGIKVDEKCRKGDKVYRVGLSG